MKPSVAFSLLAIPALILILGLLTDTRRPHAAAKAKDAPDTHRVEAASAHDLLRANLDASQS